MKLLAKFTLLFAFVFGAGLAVVGFVAHRFLEQNARAQVIQQARLMMETAGSARDYTTRQIKPLLISQQAHLARSCPKPSRHSQLRKASAISARSIRITATKRQRSTRRT